MPISGCALKNEEFLALSNLGDSIPLSDLGGGPNLHELNNSRFLHCISMKFCMAQRINLNVYFWHNWMKDEIAVKLQKFDLLCWNANY